MERFFILDKDHNPISADLLTWGRWFEDGANRRVARAVIGTRFEVSTVFIGLDHDHYSAALMREYGGGIPVGFYQPLLFETMVFSQDVEEIEWGGKKRQHHPEIPHSQRRYRSWDDAVKGHEDTVKLMTRYDRMLSHREKVLAQLERDL